MHKYTNGVAFAILLIYSKLFSYDDQVLIEAYELPTFDSTAYLSSFKSNTITNNKAKNKPIKVMGAGKVFVKLKYKSFEDYRKKWEMTDFNVILTIEGFENAYKITDIDTEYPGVNISGFNILDDKTISLGIRVNSHAEKLFKSLSPLHFKIVNSNTTFKLKKLEYDMESLHNANAILEQYEIENSKPVNRLKNYIRF